MTSASVTDSGSPNSPRRGESSGAGAGRVARLVDGHKVALVQGVEVAPVVAEKADAPGQLRQLVEVEGEEDEEFDLEEETEDELDEEEDFEADAEHEEDADAEPAEDEPVRIRQRYARRR
jgi:hypothetical protein